MRFRPRIFGYRFDSSLVFSPLPPGRQAKLSLPRWKQAVKHTAQRRIRYSRRYLHFPRPHLREVSVSDGIFFEMQLPKIFLNTCITGLLARTVGQLKLEAPMLNEALLLSG
jgi:hypothetical protein